MTNNYNKKKIFEYLDREYLAHLPDQGYGKNNKNLIIFFSGRSGVGKSTFARAIANKFKALNLSNDDIRILVQSYFKGECSIDLRNQIMWDYANYTYSALDKAAANRLWVKDSMVDRFYSFYFDWCEAHDFDKFIISFQIPDTETDEAILKRPAYISSQTTGGSTNPTDKMARRFFEK